MLLLLSSVLAGISLCCLICALTQPVTRPHLAAGVEGASLGLRLVWPWVSTFAPFCEPFISWRARAKLTRQIQLSGLAEAWLPAHVLALQFVVFLLTSIITWISLFFLISSTWSYACFWALVAGALAAWLPRYRMVVLGKLRQACMLRELPFLLDMTTLCVEAGLNLQGALQQSADYGPPGPMRSELRHALADMRAGMPRMDSLTRMATRTALPVIENLVAALAQADQMGASLGPLLRSQSDQRRAERFLRAEELAHKAPVKMLFPMVICIFPCTFLIIGFPIVSKLLSGSY